MTENNGGCVDNGSDDFELEPYIDLVFRQPFGSNANLLHYWTIFWNGVG